MNNQNNAVKVKTNIVKLSSINDSIKEEFNEMRAMNYYLLKACNELPGTEFLTKTSEICLEK